VNRQFVIHFSIQEKSKQRARSVQKKGKRQRKEKGGEERVRGSVLYIARSNSTTGSRKKKKGPKGRERGNAGWLEFFTRLPGVEKKKKKEGKRQRGKNKGGKRGLFGAGGQSARRWISVRKRKRKKTLQKKGGRRKSKADHSSAVSIGCRTGGGGGGKKRAQRKREKGGLERSYFSIATKRGEGIGKD